MLWKSKKTSQGEKKAQMRISCGGIGGLVVLVGALAAAAALMAVLRNTSRQRPTKNNHSEELDPSSEGDGVLSLLQTPSPSMEENHQSHEEASGIHSRMTDSPDSVAVKSLILDMNHSQVNVEEETPKYVNGEMDLDNSREGDLSETDDYATRNIGIPLGQEDADHSKEDTNDEASVETQDIFRDTIEKEEENPSMQLLGNDNKEDNGGSSEETGDSPLESNAETVWMTDLIECPSKTQIESPGNIVEKEAENGVDMEEIVEGNIVEKEGENDVDMEEVMEGKIVKKETENGVLSLLQNPSPSMEEENHQSHEEASLIHSRTTDSPDWVAIKSLILDMNHSQVNVEEEPPNYVNGEMDLDNSREGDLAETDDYATRNIGIPLGQEDADHSKENTNDAASVETKDIFRDTIEKEEEKPPMQLLGNDNKEDDNGGRSEGTGDYSLESNAETVCMTDLIECPLKTQLGPGNLVEKQAENGVGKEEVMEGKEETCSVMVMENEMQSYLSSRLFFVSTMVGLLLLLLLNHLIT